MKLLLARALDKMNLLGLQRFGDDDWLVYPGGLLSYNVICVLFGDRAVPF